MIPLDPGIQRPFALVVDEDQLERRPISLKAKFLPAIICQMSRGKVLGIGKPVQLPAPGVVVNLTQVPASFLVPVVLRYLSLERLR